MTEDTVNNNPLFRNRMPTKFRRRKKCKQEQTLQQQATSVLLLKAQLRSSQTILQWYKVGIIDKRTDKDLARIIELMGRLEGRL